MESPRGARETVDPYSCPVTRQTPPRMCCSGSWKANGRADTSLTGERVDGDVPILLPPPLPVGVLLKHVFSFSPFQ